MNKNRALQVIRRSGGKFDEQQREILVKMIEALPGGGGGDGPTVSLDTTPMEGGQAAADVWLDGAAVANGVGLKVSGDQSTGYTISLVQA